MVVGVMLVVGLFVSVVGRQGGTIVIVDVGQPVLVEVVGVGVVVG